MGKIIALVSQKGGVGKTTIAAHLAVQLSKGKKKVAIIDLDRVQANLTDWWKDRVEEQKKTDIELVELSEKEILDNATAIKSVYDYIIIDTRPSVEKDVEKVINAADLCLVPSKAGSNDLRAVAGTLQLIGSDKKFGFIINETRGSRLVAQAAMAMSKYGEVVATIPDKLSLVEVMANGRVIQDIKTEKAMVKELENIANFVKNSK